MAHGFGRALARAGHDVTVCTTNLENEHHDLDVPVNQPVEVDGVRVFYCPTTGARYWGFSPALARRSAAEISRCDVVFLHFHYQFASVAGAFYARKLRKPFIVFAHGSLNRGGISHKNGFAKRAYLRMFEEKNFREALFVVFNSDEEKMNSLYSSLGRVIPSGIDTTGATVAAPCPSFRDLHPELRDRIVILFLGRLDFQGKGLDLLLPAFSRVVDGGHPVHLVLAGPDHQGGLDQVKGSLSRLGIEECVTVTGLIQGKEKEAALRDCDAFVLPSRFEGLSIALLEAMHAGLPVLLTENIGFAGKVKEVGAGVVARPETDDVYRGLLQLINPETRTGMRGRGKSFIASSCNWDSISNRILAEIAEASRES